MLLARSYYRRRGLAPWDNDHSAAIDRLSVGIQRRCRKGPRKLLQIVSLGLPHAGALSSVASARRVAHCSHTLDDFADELRSAAAARRSGLVRRSGVVRRSDVGDDSSRHQWVAVDRHPGLDPKPAGLAARRHGQSSSARTGAGGASLALAANPDADLAGSESSRATRLVYLQNLAVLAYFLRLSYLCRRLPYPIPASRQCNYQR